MLSKIVSTTSKAVINYHYLWFSYLNGRNTVSVFCFGWGVDCQNYISEKNDPNIKKDIRINYQLPADKHQFNSVEKLRNKTGKYNGNLVEGHLSGPPCLNETIIKIFEIKEICQILELVSNNSKQFL